MNLSLDFSLLLVFELVMSRSSAAISAIFGHEDDLDNFLDMLLLDIVVGVGGSDGSHRVMQRTLVRTFITSSSTEGWKLEGVPDADKAETVSASWSSLGDPTESLDIARLVQELPPALSGKI